MNATDKRHGTNVGYNAGCRDHCCKHAHMVWMKRYRMYGSDGLWPARGTHRRIEALAALGYPLTVISKEMGMSSKYVGKILKVDAVRPQTANAVDALYERLCMIRPEGWMADRSRRQAAEKGWAVPLEWDDIDLDDAPFSLRYPDRKAA